MVSDGGTPSVTGRGGIISTAKPGGGGVDGKGSSFNGSNETNGGKSGNSSSMVLEFGSYFEWTAQLFGFRTTLFNNTSQI